MTHRSSLGLALLVFTSVASAQDAPAKPKPAEKKKGAAQKVEIQVKVAATDGKPLPTGSTVEISGQDPACGSLNQVDARATVDGKGEAVFQDLPACKVTVKINLNLYLPKTVPVDLTAYKSCASAAPAKRNGETGQARPACEAVSLLLDPVTGP